MWSFQWQPFLCTACQKPQSASTLFAAPGHTRLLSWYGTSLQQRLSHDIFHFDLWSRQYWCFFLVFLSFISCFCSKWTEIHVMSLPELVTRCVETMSVSHLLWGHRRLGFESYLPTIRQFVYVVFFFQTLPVNSVRNKHPNAHNETETSFTAACRCFVFQVVAVHAHSTLPPTASQLTLHSWRYT